MSIRSVTFRTEPDQAVAATRLIMRRKTRFPIWPVVLVGIPVALTGIIIGGDGMFGIALPLMSWLVLILCIIVAFIHYWMLPRQARRSFQQTKLMQQESRLTWDDDGFSLEGENARSSLRWSDLYAWGEQDDLIVLLQSELLYNLVPLVALQQEQSNDLRSCLERSGLKRI
ncbi:YcxB family protein [Altererythrobacter lutimaris]|uniref:YcxB family protein n=1 Tax=Altererythrobacter lutimaris TaxID=2743979 RepID=A0A850HBH7_9SPHN|nr:YcxB family protein [Altererythrobacter lutimaris]NVE93908.1 YcxB family protein [Altererythrobacter lutimaris]